MVAARSVQDAPGASVGRSTGIDRLAVRWAALGPRSDPALAPRLTLLLRRLAATLAAEPFWPLAARDIGADLLFSGLCGAPDDVASAAEEVIAPTLSLLRTSAVDALGVHGPDAAERVAIVLDELITGFLGALRSRIATDGVDVRRALALSETHYRAVYTQGAIGIGIARLDGMVVDLNPALCAMFGIPSPIDRSVPFSDFVHPDDLTEAVRRYRRLVRGDPDVLRMPLRFVRPDGLVLPTHVVVSLVRNGAGRPAHLIVVVEDQSERDQLRLRAQRAAYHDQLTQLPNRSFAEQWVHREFESGVATGVGLCVLGLDGLDRVIDGLGHHVGDQVLLAVAARLQLAAQEHLVTRTDGDEFAVLVSDPSTMAEVLRIADRLLEAFAAPFVVGGHSLTISAGVGVAQAPTARACPDELLRAAHVAMSWAKDGRGSRRVVFDPERDAGESERFALLTGLPRAIQCGELRLHYQPLVAAGDGALRGVEALVRWQHPEQGLLGPARFIGLAEHSGAIVDLGRWVLRTACEQAAQWRREFGDAAPFISVNVSPLQLVEPGWVQEVVDALVATGLPPDRLQLEITEQAVLADEAVAMEALTALRASGVRLALDDFGTGYSSLVWLRRLPVQALKIDGSFVQGLRHPVADPMDSSIVEALIAMAHALGLEVTGEWVETDVQAQRLAGFGCDLVQGRWFGDAGPGQWVTDRLARSIGG